MPKHTAWDFPTIDPAKRFDERYGAAQPTEEDDKS